MANNAQNSQNKSDNLGRGRVAYAFKISRVNPDFVSFKIWILGYYSKVCSIAVASLPKIIAQIDTALADGECEFEIGGIRFSADEKLLGKIRKELSSYCCNVGVSDANNAQVNPQRVVATESVKKCGAKPKASAPQGSASAARQFKSRAGGEKSPSASDANEILPQAKDPKGETGEAASQLSNEERRTKNEELSTPAGVAADTAKEENNSSFSILNSSLRAAGEAAFIAQSASQADSACGADASAVADELIQAFREALRAELAPIREALEELSFKAEEMAVFAKGNSALELPESSLPRTRRGRTSVVVGVRKVTKFQPKTKGK